MIELTNAAVARIRKQLAARGHGLGIRLGVKRSGCSGYGYDIDFLDALSDDLQTFPFEGFVLAIPHTDAEMLAGLRVDVKKEGLNEYFSFENPQASATCGCGTSFSIS